MGDDAIFFDGKIKKDDNEFEEEDEIFSDDGSVQSLPEMCDLEDIICNRYMLPKNIPKPEMLVCLHLSEFNELMLDLEDKIESVNEPILKFEKRVKKIENYEKYYNNNQTPSSSRQQQKGKGKNRNKPLLSAAPKALSEKEKETHDKLLKDLAILLQKKSRIESYYSFILLKTIQSHPNPTKALTSIQKLLEHDKSTIHSLTLHLDHFAYIDSGLDECDSDEDSESSLSSFG